jgi:PPOX class probable F420-dependent enzyme
LIGFRRTVPDVVVLTRTRPETKLARSPRREGSSQMNEHRASVSSTSRPERGRAFVTLVLLAAGAFMLGGGVWCLASPISFARVVNFPYNRHFIHDAGAFQIGIGITLLLAAAWADAIAVTLAGFFVANSVHAVNHAVDRDLGGHGSDAWGLAAISALTVAALLVRMRQLGWVAGDVKTTAAVPTLERFVRQKTVRLTSYRCDGTPVGAPVSIVVDGDRAFVRSPGKGGKVKRIRNNPVVEVAPCTSLGKATGPAARMRARLVQGEEFQRAAHLLRRKYPLLQGAFVPLAHRLFHGRFGSTVHIELKPLDVAHEEPAEPTLRMVR